MTVKIKLKFISISDVLNLGRKGFTLRGFRTIMKARRILEYVSKISGKGEKHGS